MKFMVINKRKLGVTVIVFGLMLILLAVYRGFDFNLKKVILIENNIDLLKKYEVVKEELSYKLPDKWKTNIKDLNSNEIVYHNDFMSDNSIINGFVQVWNYNNNLKEFLQTSKKVAEKHNGVRGYGIKTIKVQEYNGYEVEYTLSNQKGESYRACEYFIKLDKKKFIRFSFFVREKNYQENITRLFQTIVETVNKE